MGDVDLVAIRGEVSPRVSRLAHMRKAELGLNLSQYLAALIIADTKHLGSITERTTEIGDYDDGNNGDAAA